MYEIAAPLPVLQCSDVATAQSAIALGYQFSVRALVEQ
jgi:hypothetical protein